VAWQNSHDGSIVYGQVKAGNAAIVTQNDIPWLKVTKVGDENGAAGGDVLTKTTFIQRLNTHGGVAPLTGCTSPVKGKQIEDFPARRTLDGSRSPEYFGQTNRRSRSSVKRTMHSTLTRSLAAAVVTLAVGHSTAALACKDLRPPEHVSTLVVDAHSDVVVAAVEGTEPNGRGNPVEEMSGRPRPFKARIKIERSLKGQTSPGDVVSIETTNGEEAHAICPLNLEPGLTYLLFLTRDGNQLLVSRYTSMTKSMKDPRAATYVRDVESRVASAPASRAAPKVEGSQPSKNRDGGAD